MKPAKISNRFLFRFKLIFQLTNTVHVYKIPVNVDTHSV